MNGMLSVISSFSSPPVLLALHGFRSDCHLSSNKETSRQQSLTSRRGNNSCSGPDLLLPPCPLLCCHGDAVSTCYNLLQTLTWPCSPSLPLSLFLICRVSHSCMHWCNFPSDDLAVFLFFSWKSVSEHFLHHVSQQYVIMLHLHTLSHLVVFLIWP